MSVRARGAAQGQVQLSKSPIAAEALRCKHTHARAHKQTHAHKHRHDIPAAESWCPIHPLSEYPSRPLSEYPSHPLSEYPSHPLSEYPSRPLSENAPPTELPVFVFQNDQAPFLSHSSESLSQNDSDTATESRVAASESIRRRFRVAVFWQTMVDLSVDAARRHGVRAELVVVDWNPQVQ